MPLCYTENMIALHLTLLRLGALLWPLMAALALAAGAVGAASPAANQIAYTARPRGQTDIFLIDVERRLAANLTRHPAEDLLPAWSPDGQRLAFLSNRLGEGFILHVMDAPAARPYPLAIGYRASAVPAWSPDGGRLAIVSSIRGSAKIVIVGLDGTEPYILNQTSATDSPPLWSPDGGWLVYLSFRDGNPRLYAASPNCIEKAQGCRFNDFLLLASTIVSWPPAWSPDGRWLALSAMGSGSLRLYRVEIGCTTQPQDCVGQRQRLDTGHESDWTPVWSPDGQKLAFASRPASSTDLFVIDLATGAVRQLTDDPASEQLPAWSPDGRYLAYISTRDWGLNIHLVDTVVGGSAPLTVRGIADVMTPAWRPVRGG